MSSIQALLEDRYFRKGETCWEDIANRVGAFLCGGDEHVARSIRQVIKDKLFIPSSPVLMNAGASAPMMCSCFVLPVEDSIEGIMRSLKDTMMIQKYGGGVGINFSPIRQEGCRVSSTGGLASGPVSFMGFWNEGMNVIRQGGKRQGAMMGVLNVDHPDLDLFLQAKEVEGKLTNFNLSVGLTGDFMEKAEHSASARQTLTKIAECAWRNGEPGFLFLDNINKDSPFDTPIEATNPCGEVPLPPYGACCLGSINLTKCMVERDGAWEMNWEKLRHAASWGALILNNVLDYSWWPLPEIAEFQRKYRPIGLGVMGLADVLALSLYPYGSYEAVGLTKKILRVVREVAESMYGNTTYLSIAPTGSIAMLAECSYSIEPYFSLSYTKKVEAGDFKFDNWIVDAVAKASGYTLTPRDEFYIQNSGSMAETYAPTWMKQVLRTANEIPWIQHLLTQSTVQREVDNAVSKTINLPQETTAEEVLRIIVSAHDLGLKGLTVYRNKSREKEVINCPSGKCDV